MPIRMSGMVSGLDTDAIIKELMSAQSMKKTSLEQKKEKLSWKKEKWEEMNTKVYSFYTDKLSSLKLQGSYLTKKVTTSNDDKVSASVSNAGNGSYTLEIKSLATAQYVTGSDIKDKDLKGTSLLAQAGMAEGQTITIKAGENLDKTVTFKVESDSTIDDLMSKMKDAGLNASFDAGTGRVFIGSNKTGAAGRFTIESDETTAGAGLDALGLANITEDLAKSGSKADDATQLAVVAGTDAEIILNGAHITSSNNTIQANGITLDLKGVTAEGERINMTVNNDVDAVYDKVKDFFKEYNELLKGMYDSYNASSAKGYNMLTDDEKEAMSEKQVELWENKIKDSLLRRDDALNSLMSTMRSAMQETVEVDGKTYSLSSFGIVTGTYTENGLLHINGNEDDPTYADNKDLLKTALEDDPETVGKALSQIMSKLYNSLTEKMSATSISSALTFYNDKQLQSQMDDYEKQITSWETRLTDMEDRYYKQFSTMETAMADLQQKQNQLAGLLGG